MPLYLVLYIAALFCYCFCLTMCRATFFQPETIDASFLQLMLLFFKVIFNHTWEVLILGIWDIDILTPILDFQYTFQQTYITHKCMNSTRKKFSELSENFKSTMIMKKFFLTCKNFNNFLSIVEIFSKITNLQDTEKE